LISAPPCAQLRQRCERAVDDAPEVDVEQPSRIFLADFLEPAPDGQPRVVDPRVEPAEALDRFPGEVVHLRAVRDVAHDGMRLPASGVDAVHDVVERLAAARRKHDLGALLRSALGGAQADAAGGAGDDDDLVFQLLEFDGHGETPLCHGRANEVPPVPRMPEPDPRLRLSREQAMIRATSTRLLEATI
jgi:hypothetical protein